MQRRVGSFSLDLHPDATVGFVGAAAVADDFELIVMRWKTKENGKLI